MNLIVGGTHGLGLEIAKAYQEAGEETFVTGRSYDAAQHGLGLAVDLAEQDDVSKLVKHIEKLGESALTRFFWVAGYGYVGDFAEQPDPEKMAEVNFAHVMPVAQAAWRKQLSIEEPTNFVIVSSTTGVKPRQDEAVYAATKHAQVGFARSLGLESERLDAQVCVALFMPGGMQTPFWEGNEPGSFDEFLDPTKVAQRIVTAIANHREHFYQETIERGSL